MRILFLSPRFPYPPLKGEQLRTYQFIKNLKQMGNQVILVTFFREQDRPYLPEMEKLCTEMHLIRIPPWEKAMNFFWVLFSGIPLQTFPFFSKEAQKTIGLLIKQHKVDVVQIELIRMAHYLRDLVGFPVVLDLVDSLALNMRRRFERENLILKMPFYLEWRKMQAYEGKICREAEKLLVVSGSEKAAVGGGSKIAIVPVGVDLKTIKPEAQKPRVPGRIIFTGNLSYFPNSDAVKYFMKNVFPLIKKRRPDAVFCVVGANPPKWLKRLHNGRDVLITGSVKDIYEHIKTAAVSVAPLRSGTGMQIKVIEALACRTAVVATNLAIGGIKCEDGKHLLIADRPTEFAEKVTELLGNPQKAYKVAEAGFNLINQGYTWDKITEKLMEIYTSLTDMNL